MKFLSWKIGTAFLTFLIGIILTLIWLSPANKQIIVEGTNSTDSKLSVSEVKINETVFENKTSATKDVDSKNKPDETDFNPPIRYIKNGGKFCEKYILKKIEAEKSPNNSLIKLTKFNPQNENLSPNVKKWLGFMRLEDLEVTQLKNAEQEALLLRSTDLAATGLSTSLENWHIEIDNFYSEGFWSFSKNPKLIFWDKKGILNYYLVDYSDAFLSAASKRDNLSFNIEHYRISEGKTELIEEEINLSCK